MAWILFGTVEGTANPLIHRVTADAFGAVPGAHVGGALEYLGGFEITSHNREGRIDQQLRVVGIDYGIRAADGVSAHVAPDPTALECATRRGVVVRVRRKHAAVVRGIAYQSNLDLAEII